MLIIVVGESLLNVGRVDNFASSSHRRLGERSSFAQFFQYAGLFKFLFKAFQGFIDRFVFFDVDNQHVLPIWAANIALLNSTLQVLL
jgi:hypothetical protein